MFANISMAKASSHDHLDSRLGKRMPCLMGNLQCHMTRSGTICGYFTTYHYWQSLTQQGIAVLIYALELIQYMQISISN